MHKLSLIGAFVAASVSLSACQHTTSGVGTVINNPDDAPPDQTATAIRSTQAGRPIFATVNPGPRVGRRFLSANLFGQLPDPIRYDDGTIRAVAKDKLDAARSTERRESWMDIVTRNNDRARAGETTTLMTGVDPVDPIVGAQDIATRYGNLLNSIFSRTGAERSRFLELIEQAYRDTIAARQDTALIIQAEPRLEHWVDYVGYEAGRRLLGDLLVRGGVFVERRTRRDSVPSYGFLDATAIGLPLFAGRDFGQFQVLLGSDQAQARFGREAAMQVEADYMNSAYRLIRDEAREFQRLQKAAAARFRDEQS